MYFKDIYIMQPHQKHINILTTIYLWEFKEADEYA